MVWTACLVAVALAALGHAQQYQECYNDAVGSPGVCSRLQQCRWAQQLIQNHQYPQICYWESNLPVVCCPVQQSSPATRPPWTSTVPSWSNPNPTQSSFNPTRPNFNPSRPNFNPTQSSFNPTRPSFNPSRPTPAPTKKPIAPTKKPSTGSQRGRISKRKCEEYAQYVFREEEESFALSPLVVGERINLCAAPADALIVGGEEAMPKEFPHMALVGYGESRDNIDFQCGGSLISPDFVLTAAHCIIAPGNREARWVLLGELDRATEQDDAKPQLIQVRERIRHPEHRPPQQYNDIALLRLSRPATINEYVRPACLNVDREVRQTAYGGPMATGWGHTEWAGDPSDKLMKVSLDIQPFRLCNESYRTNTGRTLPRGILDDVQMCAGVLEGGKDTCQGDSGGPLQLYSATNPYCVYHIIGVTSFGKACGFRNSPAVYTRVSTFVPWIESIVWPGA